MRTFHCDHCQHSIFFENTFCGNCGHQLAYLPELKLVASLDIPEKAPVDPLTQVWTSPVPGAKGRSFRLCKNYVTHQVCNWAVPVDDPDPFCVSCRLTTQIPDLNRMDNPHAWQRLEIAKRRLIYSLMEHRLPIQTKKQNSSKGLEFHFLENLPGSPPVLTGHENGVITVNIAEADHVERERRRVLMHEPYRTVLGHFRHEIGHYYWDLLIKDAPRLEDFRKQFGDERADYAQSLRNHYEHGPAGNWHENFVSEYASVHPWEDWAETWAHYLHMTDTLETAAVCGVSLQPARHDEPTMDIQPRKGAREQSFDEIIANWFPLTYMLNSLNRGMGLADAYPFVLPPPAIDKLRFIHKTICMGGES